MTMKLVSSIALVLGAGSMLAACDIQQPTAGCIVQDSASWAATYELKANQPTCTTPAPVGELVGVYKFTTPEKENSTLLTLRPAGLASRGGRDTTTEPSAQTASGALAEEPDAEFFCSAPTMSEARVDTRASTSGDKTQISYTFSNVKVYSNPRAPGTQLKADLVYNRDGCPAEYTMNAMWPARGCDVAELEKPEADRDPAALCGSGSLINPDFKVRCETRMPNLVVRGFTPEGTPILWPGTCVLDAPVPAFIEEQK
jgi:hypothetical protein